MAIRAATSSPWASIMPVAMVVVANWGKRNTHVSRVMFMIVRCILLMRMTVVTVAVSCLPNAARLCHLVIVSASTDQNMGSGGHHDLCRERSDCNHQHQQSRKRHPPSPLHMPPKLHGCHLTVKTYPGRVCHKFARNAILLSYVQRWCCLPCAKLRFTPRLEAPRSSDIRGQVSGFDQVQDPRAASRRHDVCALVRTQGSDPRSRSGCGPRSSLPQFTSTS
jgi:hypothetical protein